jgi:hypothetical protein
MFDRMVDIINKNISGEPDDLTEHDRVAVSPKNVTRL